MRRFLWLTLAFGPEHRNPITEIPEAPLPHERERECGGGEQGPGALPDPDRFDPTRKNFAHLTFGAGPHVCLGMPLARMETMVAINALLDRLPELHLDPTAPQPVINGVAFRSPAALPVEFTAA